MKHFQLKLPKLGESIHSAKMVRWLKKVGDYVHLDEPICEVTTDKVSSEIPSPVRGKILELYAAVDEEIEVGKAIALIDVEGKEEEVKQVETPHHRFYSPAVLRLAEEAGLSMQDLDRIEGHGAEGRLTKKDLEEFVASRKTKGDTTSDRIEMSPMRKAIAETMVRSFYAAPHASLMIEVDLTAVLQEIQAQKESFFTQHGVKLTVTSYFAWAIARAAKEHGMINSSLHGDTILLHRNVDLGIAVSVDQGILVPVIRGCAEKELPEIAKAVADFSERARQHKLQSGDMGQGTITITNFGMGHALLGIPIIRHPEVAIIGIGAIEKRVVVRDNAMAIRDSVYLTLTFDHRVIDGMYGCAFLKAVKDKLESI